MESLELCKSNITTTHPLNSRGGYSWEFLLGVCRPVIQILTLFEIKKCHFYTRFQTWPPRNDVIITQIGTSTKGHKSDFLICPFLFLSYSFGIKRIHTFIHSSGSLDNHTRFQTKMAKCIPVFRPKRRKNPTRWGGTYLYGTDIPPGLNLGRTYVRAVKIISS